MTHVTEPTGGPDATTGRSMLDNAGVGQALERPARAPGVQLIGELPETGFTQQQWLVQRDERFVQVTELLYLIVEEADGDHTLGEIAQHVSERSDWIVTADQIRQLIATKLVPQGIIGAADAGTGLDERDAVRRPSPLGVNLRTKVIGPRVIDPIARVLAPLHSGPVVIAVLALTLLGQVWLFASNSISSSVIAVLYTPGLLLAAIGIMVLASIWHEFGHASALVYGGGKVRGMGVGLYLIYPAFYTDTTDVYRLGRWARVRTDLGGFYFYLIFSLLSVGLFAITGAHSFLLVVLLIDVDIIRQSLPFVRFDGYWALADLTGIPDFLSQIVPFARSVSSKAGSGTKLPHLKRWVRITFIAYILITLPALGFLLWIMVTRMPALLTVIVGALLSQMAAIPHVLGEGNVVSSVFALVQVLVLGLEALGIAFLFVSLGRTLVAVARGQATKRAQTIAAVIVALLGVAAAYTWIPNLPFGQGAAPAGTQTFEVTDRSHVRTPVEYAQTPAVGGAHSPVVQNCGFYSHAVDDETAVHSLEHGAVWIAYQADLPGEDLTTLRALARRESYLLASPVDDLPAPIVASAWGRQLRLNIASDGRLVEFIDAFAGKGEAPEAGGPCTGGTGSPEP